MTPFGKYILHEPLGQGGYGTVYRATDTTLNVARAVKVLHPQLAANPEFVTRFRREGQFAAQLEHSHIVPVYELGEHEGRYYLAMRLMPGGSLKERLTQHGALPFAQAFPILKQVAEALEFAHQHPEKLVHRDLKPANILFETDGQVRLADFGFAKALSGSQSASLSSTGAILGTPAYMAPEIWREQGATPASDVYSLTCVFVEMLTGEVLFAGDSAAGVMTQHLIDGPRFPSVWPEGCPDGLQAVVEKGLAQKVEGRFGSAGRLVEGVRGLQVVKGRRGEEETKRKNEEEPGEIPVEQPSLPPKEEEAKQEQIVKSLPKNEKPTAKKGSRISMWGWIALGSVMIVVFLLGIIVILIGGSWAMEQNSKGTSPEISPTQESIVVAPANTIVPSQTLAQKIPTTQPTNTIQNPTVTNTPTKTSTATPEPTVSIKLINYVPVEVGTVNCPIDNAFDHMEWSSDESLFVAVCATYQSYNSGFNPEIKIWSTTNWELIKTIQGGLYPITDLEISPENQFLASAGNDGMVRIYNINTGVSEFLLSGHAGKVHTLAWSPDGTRIASAGRDGTLRMWSAESGEQIWSIQAHVADDSKGGFGGALWVDWSTSGNYLSSIGNGDSYGSNFAIWNAQSGVEVWQTKGEYFLDGQWSPTEDTIALEVEMDDKLDIVIRDLNTESLIYAGINQDGISFSWSNNGQSIVFNDDEGFINIWDIKNNNIVYSTSPYTDNKYFNFGWLYIDENLFIRTNAGIDIKLWDSSNLQQINSTANALDSFLKSGDYLVFSPSGTQVLIGNYNVRYNYVVWDLQPKIDP